MDLGKDRPVGQFGRHILVIYGILVVLALPVVILVFFSNVFQTSEPGSIPDLVWLMAAGVLLFMVILMLSRLSKIFEVIEENNAKLERIAESLERNHAVLSQIDQIVGLAKRPRLSPSVTRRGSRCEKLFSISFSSRILRLPTK
jgi:hypothetical protein